MKKLLLIATALLCSGCYDNSIIGTTREISETRNYCKADTAILRSEFILQCLKNANPKSDEEPEDWIYQCKEMAEETLCPLIEVTVKQECRVKSGFSNECSWWSDRVISETHKTKE